MRTAGNGFLEKRVDFPALCYTRPRRPRLEFWYAAYTRRVILGVAIVCLMDEALCKEAEVLQALAMPRLRLRVVRRVARHHIASDVITFATSSTAILDIVHVFEYYSCS